MTRVWGVRCPDGRIDFETKVEAEAREDAAWCDDEHGALTTPCRGSHVVVYADIEWKEETE